MNIFDLFNVSRTANLLQLSPYEVSLMRERLNWSLPVVMFIFGLLAVPLRGVTVAEKMVHRFSPAVRILNPYYIRIATAVVKNDDAALTHYAAKMEQFANDKSRPYLWFPATRARTFCLARLNHEESFVKSFALLCHAKGVLENRDKLVPFAQAIFARLNKHKRSAWVAAATQAALPKAGPPPGKLYLYLLNTRLAGVRNAHKRFNIIHDAIGQTKVWILKHHLGGGKQFVFSTGLRNLRLVAVNNDASSLDIPHLQSDATYYIAHYGADDKGSAMVFLTSIQTFIRAWLLSANPAEKARIINAGGWMANWYEKIVANAGQLAPQISHEWVQWRRLEQMAPAGK